MEHPSPFSQVPMKVGNTVLQVLLLAVSLIGVALGLTLLSFFLANWFCYSPSSEIGSPAYCLFYGGGLISWFSNIGTLIIFMSAFLFFTPIIGCIFIGLLGLVVFILDEVGIKGCLVKLAQIFALLSVTLVIVNVILLMDWFFGNRINDTLTTLGAPLREKSSTIYKEKQPQDTRNHRQNYPVTNSLGGLDYASFEEKLFEAYYDMGIDEKNARQVAKNIIDSYKTMQATDQEKSYYLDQVIQKVRNYKQ